MMIYNQAGSGHGLFATIGETGLPINVLNFCWYTVPLNKKYLVVRINTHSVMMSSTHKIVLSGNVLSADSLSDHH